jgi:hypothetical protein
MIRNISAEMEISFSVFKSYRLRFRDYGIVITNLNSRMRNVLQEEECYRRYLKCYVTETCNISVGYSHFGVLY